ncbi:hypothetical protein EG328_010391 [Venturia inaequalis]|uniref:Ammonium transporter AmtB-like domain-containing protein n=1 Tax=Venturia inaequalis TaxID=5025 RepID=A0A8H3Z856_VENIN|nr:hypothetical protein EG328_010391 [Venturia inaequalis]
MFIFQPASNRLWGGQSDCPKYSHKFLEGDIAWILISTELVFLMVLGLSFMYCGTVHSRLSLQMASFPVVRVPGGASSQEISFVNFCNGAIIGLVCITPAAGFVPHQVAPVFGIVGAAVCFGLMQTHLSEVVADMHCIFILHAVDEFVGMILTGIFAWG